MKQFVLFLVAISFIAVSFYGCKKSTDNKMDCRSNITQKENEMINNIKKNYNILIGIILEKKDKLTIKYKVIGPMKNIVIIILRQEN